MIKIIILFNFLFAVTSSDKIEIYDCGDNDVKAEHCTIHEVRINPCVKNYLDDFCELLHNNIYDYITDTFHKDATAPAYINNTISVDYTPHFPITDLTLAIYFSTWKHPNYPPLPAFDTSKYPTGTWPISNDDINTINVEWANFPEDIYRGRSLFKIKMWNKDDQSKQCCFRFMIRHCPYLVYYADEIRH